MRFLRQNTAVRITVGPFFDKTDGITPEVALTATNEKLTFMVDDDDGSAANLIIDANATASGGNNDLIHVSGDDAGFYDLELTAAQTNYVGRAMLAITYATAHCPVFHEFMIVPANVYDSLFGTDKLQVDSVEISSDSTAADNLEDFYEETTAIGNLIDMFDGTGYAGGTIQLKSDATLNATQGSYAPAKAGDKMDIVDAPNATGLAAIADAFLKRDWTSVTGEATRSVLNALRPLLNKWTSATGAGGYVVKKEDDSTTAWTGTLTVDENGNISGMDHD